MKYLLLSISLLFTIQAHAASQTFFYKLSPGQIWQATIKSQTQGQMMGQRQRDRDKQTIEYQILKGPKNGWVTIKARILPSPSQADNPMDQSKLIFTADMHKSGEIRHKSVAGLEQMLTQMTGGQGVPPQMRAMFQQSIQQMATSLQSLVFWFPEFPARKLQPGDDFERKQKIGSGGASSNMRMRTLARQVFTLEEISNGLAYFSVKQTSKSNMRNQLTGPSKIKTAGKGDAVFDIRLGMWEELTQKDRINMNSAAPAMGMNMGQSNNKLLSITQITMRQK